LVRAAAVGGAGYALGKRRANVEGQDDAAPVADEPVADEPVADEPVADEPGLGDDSIAALEKIGELKERGILTQQEFDEQKARILETS
jgi:hypothetical protein